MTRNRRPNANDDLRNHPPVFGRLVSSFAETVPEVADFTLEAREYSVGNSTRTLSERTFSMANMPAEYMECHNPVCSHGGFPVAQFIRDMAREKRTSHEGTLMCVGHENMGRYQARECLNLVEVKATVTYKE